MFEQNELMKTPEMFLQVTSRIKQYKDYYEELGKDNNQHTGTIYLLRLIDELLKKEFEEPYKSGKVKDYISCRKGCAHCCRQKVSASQQEVDLILDFCKEENIPIDIGYLKQQQELTQENWGLSEDYADCVFLDDNQACKIYAARPAACRKYVVMTDPDLCNIKDHPKGEVGTFGVVGIEIVASVFPNLTHEAEDLSLSTRLYNSLTQSNGQAAGD